MKKHMSTGTMVKLAVAVTGAALLIGVAAWNVVWMSGAVEQYSAAPVSKKLVKAKYDALRESAAEKAALSRQQSEGLQGDINMPLPLTDVEGGKAAGREETAHDVPDSIKDQTPAVSKPGSETVPPVVRTSPRKMRGRASAGTVPQAQTDVHDLRPSDQSQEVQKMGDAVKGISREDDTLVVTIRKNKKPSSGETSAGTLAPLRSAVPSQTSSLPVYTVVTSPTQHPTSTTP